LVEDVEGDHAIVLVAETDGVCGRPARLHLAPYGVADLGMAVVAAWRGRGIGTALLAEAVERARKAGAHKIALQVWPHNAAALPSTSASASTARAT
jgi:GNAT superfamily N-acetyltransferase